MKPINAFAAILLTLVLVSCARLSDKVQTPGLKASIEIKDNKEIFILTFTGSKLNEHGSTIFRKVKGRIELADPKEKKLLYSLPLEIAEILPMATERIELKRDLPDKEMMTLIGALGASREDFIKNREIENLPVDEKSVKFVVDSCEKRNIIEALGEKIK